MLHCRFWPGASHYGRQPHRQMSKCVKKCPPCVALQVLRLEPHIVVSNHTGVPLQLLQCRPMLAAGAIAAGAGKSPLPGAMLCALRAAAGRPPCCVMLCLLGALSKADGAGRFRCLSNIPLQHLRSQLPLQARVGHSSGWGPSCPRAEPASASPASGAWATCRWRGEVRPPAAALWQVAPAKLNGSPALCACFRTLRRRLP